MHTYFGCVSVEQTLDTEEFIFMEQMDDFILDTVCVCVCGMNVWEEKGKKFRSFLFLCCTKIETIRCYVITYE